MTRDDITRMAREAGFTDASFCRWSAYTDDLYRFAALVAAAEREACAKVCETMWHEWLDSPEENEPNKPDAEDCYRAIRTRGEK
jgi:hypothetical protein